MPVGALTVWVVVAISSQILYQPVFWCKFELNNNSNIARFLKTLHTTNRPMFFPLLCVRLIRMNPTRLMQCYHTPFQHNNLLITSYSCLLITDISLVSSAIIPANPSFFFQAEAFMRPCVRMGPLNPHLCIMTPINLLSAHESDGKQVSADSR